MPDPATPPFTGTRRRAIGAAIGALGALTFDAWAAWPEKPIELVVGFAAGGGTDNTARTLAQYLSRQLGAQVVVSNKPGASGELGLAHVAKSAPDGYVIGVSNMPGLVTLPMERRTRFKAGDFTYIANLVRDPSAFSVLISSPYRSIDDLVADAKARPGQISYGSTGTGTDDHLALVLFQRLTGTRFTHVPYSGAGPLRTAVLGGHVLVGGMNLGEAMPYRDKLRLLAQASPGRSRLAPDVPSFTEQHVDLVCNSERGVIAPAGLPADVQQRLGNALRQIAADPAFHRQMQAQFTEMDYLEGAAWEARLDKARAEFSALWQSAPWTL